MVEEGVEELVEGRGGGQGRQGGGAWRAQVAKGGKTGLQEFEVREGAQGDGEQVKRQGGGRERKTMVRGRGHEPQGG